MPPTTTKTGRRPEDAEGCPAPSHSVLFVCTGNICRSPAAAMLFATAVSGTGIAVSSAGTHALVGEPVSGPMASLLESHGLQTGSFSARQLTKHLVRQADVVIGLAREHRSAAMQLAPNALNRAFTLLELARLLQEVPPGALDDLAGPDADPPTRLRAAVVLARRYRSPVPPGADDAADPYRRGHEAYAATYAIIQQALGPLVRATLGREDDRDHHGDR